MISERIEAGGNGAAKFISVVFHPLLIPVYGLFIIFSAPTLFGYLPLKVKGILFSIVFINNVMVPLSLIPYFRYRNIISSWAIEDQKERSVPLMTTTFFYFISSYIIIRYQIPLFIKSFIGAAALLALVLTLINFRWKISIHAAGAGALTAVTVMLSVQMHTQLTGLLILIIISSGLILSSRLWINAHVPGEVWSGFIAGFIVPASILTIFG